jgi:hypothetical protein
MDNCGMLALQIFGDRGVMRGADRGEDQRDLVALHQPPRLLHGFRRRVAVVQRNQIDLAAVDAAALVDHLEIADLALAQRAERGYRAAVGHGLADLDFGCGDAAHVGGGQRRGQCHDRKGRHSGKSAGGTHGVSSLNLPTGTMKPANRERTRGTVRLAPALHLETTEATSMRRIDSTMEPYVHQAVTDNPLHQTSSSTTAYRLDDHCPA